MRLDDLEDLEASLAMHDDMVSRRGIEIWLGAEPTFTRPAAMDPAWLAEIDGSDKLARAHALATAFADAHPGASVSRVEAPPPRFAFGVRWRDDGTGAGTRVSPDAAAEPAPHDLGDDHWLGVAPASGVVEVHLGPCPDARALGVQAHQVWRAAMAAGLSSTRYRFNGDVTDAGGGCRLSIGGSRPHASPFIRYPHVLPALIRYLNNHPSLSYWFANECVGSASQGPRPDEGTRERWDELEVTLGWLERLADRGELPPEQLSHALGPLLVDVTGDPRHAELCVERLWPPHLGMPCTRNMGVVELRAVRMPERPQMLAALAVLVRAIVARLVVSHYRSPLIDWHDELHDRFALPAALARDLRMVLGDLDEHGLGVPAQLRRELEAWRPSGIATRLGDATLMLRPALEFWPLVGDLPGHPRLGAHVVDSSTERWELSFEGAGPDRIAVGGRWAHLRSVGNGVRAIGVRRRVYQPSPGFHPGLPPTDPLVIEWAWGGRSMRIELWAWRPAGGPYPALPQTDNEALARRQERFRLTTSSGEVHATGHWAETRPFTIDLRAGECARA